MPLTRVVTLIPDVLPNDSDKTFPVTTGATWKLLSLYAQLVTTATVGNRQVDVLLTDASDNVFAKYSAGAVQAASLTRTYLFAPGHPNETSFSAGGLMLRTFSDIWQLPAGYKVRVYDSAAIDAAADDLTIRLIVEQGSG